jgi:hypothetical protein
MISASRWDFATYLSLLPLSTRGIDSGLQWDVLGGYPQRISIARFGPHEAVALDA